MILLLNRVYLVVLIDYGEIITSVLRLARKKLVSEANKFFYKQILE